MSVLETTFLIALDILHARLYHIKVEAAAELTELILDGVVLVSDFFTTRWVHFYEQQLLREQQDFNRRNRIISLKKVVLVLCLNYCLFLLLLLEIISDDP
jgi:hypothetical protein